MKYTSGSSLSNTSVADENTTAEDLIAEITEAASDFTAGEAEIFAQEARQEVAQYRQAALTFGFGEETRIRAVRPRADVRSS